MLDLSSGGLLAGIVSSVPDDDVLPPSPAMLTA
jgi:hypothetical protein